jgi:hypothetical protein
MANTSDQKASRKMICPRCGAGMNHHCDKPVYGANPHDLSEHDTDDVQLLAGGRPAMPETRRLNRVALWPRECLPSVPAILFLTGLGRLRKRELGGADRNRTTRAIENT